MFQMLALLHLLIIYGMFSIEWALMTRRLWHCLVHIHLDEQDQNVVVGENQKLSIRYVDLLFSSFIRVAIDLLNSDAKDGPGAPGGQSWTVQWLKFDNSYFKDIMERKDEELLVLPTDAVLLEDPSFKVDVDIRF
ncbi:hypothetical protein GW17_00011371 [Ensete ventricosum]|nr:hypothetical protein GW17_00011371 [Ensete ventricosum]